MSSPVRYDRAFKLGLEPPLNAFIALGHEKGSKGIAHVLYMRKPVSAEDVCRMGENTSLTGYCSYRYVYSHERIVGVVFLAMASKCKHTKVYMSVSNIPVPERFDPLFSLESMGLLVFVSTDSSVLIVPKSLNENELLVRDKEKDKDKESGHGST